MAGNVWNCQPLFNRQPDGEVAAQTKKTAEQHLKPVMARMKNSRKRAGRRASGPSAYSSFQNK